MAYISKQIDLGHERPSEILIDSVHVNLLDSIPSWRKVYFSKTSSPYDFLESESVYFESVH